MSYEVNRVGAVGRKIKLTPELTEAYREIVQKHACCLRLTPAAFFHACQIHGDFFTGLIKEQICHKLICFEGETMKSKFRSAMKWWSKRVSMTIAKTASRSLAFKASRMNEAVLESQDEIITRKPKRQETESDDNNQALDDIGYDADLYISNQVVVQD